MVLNRADCGHVGPHLARYTSKPVSAERFHHAESPGWDAAEGALFWVDQEAGEFFVGHYDQGSQALTVRHRIHVGIGLGAVVPTADEGVFMAACTDGFIAVDLTGRRRSSAPLPRVSGGRHARMNDGKCDPHGRFWAGTSAIGRAPNGADLFVLEPTGRVRVALEAVTVSNGLAWGAGGASMYFIDTPTRRIEELILGADGLPARRRPLIGIDGDGEPDGMCIDDQGCLWVALWGSGAVHRYSVSGELLGVVDVDAPQVTSCAFGRPQGHLFITTSRKGYDEHARRRFPNAGRIFLAQVDVGGPLAAPYRRR